MALLASEIDDLAKQVEESKWTPEMDRLEKAIQELRIRTANASCKPLFNTLSNSFSMTDTDARHVIQTCLENNRHYGHQLLRDLKTLLENTPS